MASPSDAVAPTEPRESTESERSAACHNENEDVHIFGVPAAVTWIDEKDNEHSLCYSAHDHVTLHVQHDSASNTAFFQLRANVSLKARRDRTHLFLSIRPEHTQSVTVVDGDDQHASVNLGTSTYGLVFKLARPPTLIVPKGDITPKQKNSRFVLDSLRALAGQTCLTVRLAAMTLARDRLVSLCEATSSGRLQSIPKFLDVASLYGGKGGHILEHESLVEVTTDAATASASAEAGSPPSYDELDPQSSHAHSLTAQSKDSIPLFGRGQSADLASRTQ